MSVAKGIKSRVLWLEEETYGVQPVGIFHEQSFIDESLAESLSKVQANDLNSERVVSDVRAGNVRVGGAITADFADSDPLFIWLAHLLGASVSTATVVPPTIATSTLYTVGAVVVYGSNYYVCVATGTTGGAITLVANKDGQTQGSAIFDWVSEVGTVYIDTYTAGPSFRTGGIFFEKQILGQGTPLFLKFNGGRFTNLSIDIEQERLVQAKWDVLALKCVDSTIDSQLPSQSMSPVAFRGSDCFLLLNNSGANRPIQGASLNISNNISEDAFVVSEQHVNALPPGLREVSGEFTTYFESPNEYNIYKTQASVALSFFFITGSSLIIVEIPEVRLTGEGTPMIGGGGVVSATFSFTAFKQLGSYDIRIKRYRFVPTLVNYWVDEAGNNFVDEAGNKFIL